jgi:alpha-glucosidase
VLIEVHRAKGSLATRAQTDGFAGSITRLRRAYDALNAGAPFGWSPDPLIDALQTGDRLSYQPQRAKEELVRFRMAYGQALTEVQRLVSEANVSDEELIGRLTQHHGLENPTHWANEYRLHLRRALAQLEDGRPN